MIIGRSVSQSPYQKGGKQHWAHASLCVPRLAVRVNGSHPVNHTARRLHEGLVEFQLLCTPFKTTCVNARQQLVECPHVGVPTPLVGGQFDAHAIQFVLRLRSSTTRIVVHGRSAILNGASKRQRLLPPFARLHKRLDVIVKPVEQRVGHERAQAIGLLVLLLLGRRWRCIVVVVLHHLHHLLLLAFLLQPLFLALAFGHGKLHGMALHRAAPC